MTNRSRRKPQYMIEPCPYCFAKMKLEKLVEHLKRCKGRKPT